MNDALAGHVADRPELLTDAQPLVDGHGPRARVEPDRLQADVVEVGRPAGRDQHLVGGQRLPRVEAEGEGAVGVRRALQLDVGQHPDPLVGEGLGEQRGGLRLVGRDQSRSVLDNGHPHAEAREDLRHLAADRSAADDDQGARELLELHGVAVGPVRRVREPVDGRDGGTGAGVEHDAAPGRVGVGGAVRLLDAHATDAVEAGDPVVDGRAGVAKPVDGDRVVPAGRGLLVDATRHDGPRRDDGGLARDLGGPAYLGHGVRAAHHHLGRDAPVVGTLTTDQVPVDDHDLDARLRRAAAEGFTARTRADHDQVDLTLAHGSSIPETSSGRKGRQSSEALLRCRLPRMPLTNWGDSSVDSSCTRAMASLIATWSGTSSA